MSLSSATSEVPAQPSTVVVAISEGIIPPSSSATPEAPAQSSSALVAVNDGQVVSSPTSSQEPVSLALQASADGSPTSTTELLSTTPLKSTTSPHLSLTTATLTSSVATVKTPATVTHSSSPIPPTSGSAGLSGAAKVGIGLGIPFGILFCAAIIYFSIRYHRHRTLRGIRPTDLRADTAEKNTKVQNRDDGVVRELY